MEEIGSTDRPQFSVAEESRDRQQTELFLDESGIMVGAPEEAPSASIADAQDAPVDSQAV